MKDKYTKLGLLMFRPKGSKQPWSLGTTFYNEWPLLKKEWYERGFECVFPVRFNKKGFVIIPKTNDSKTKL